MKIYKSSIAATLALFLLAQSGPSAANMRLPARSELPPSSSLFSPSRDLTVLHEDLHFDCDSEGCQVSATYHVRAKQQATLNMSFISPSARVQDVTVNGSNSKAGSVLVAKLVDIDELYVAAKEDAKHVDESVAREGSLRSAAVSPEYQQLLERSQLAHQELERLTLMVNRNQYVELFGKLTPLADERSEACTSPPDLSRSMGWEHYLACLLNGNQPTVSESVFGVKQQWQLYQFKFDAVILPGENTLQVQYHQPYSFAEPSVAYFRSPAPIRYVSYELWPIKEWSLDPGFKIDLVVNFKNPRHGFLYAKRDSMYVAAGRFEDEHFEGLFRNSTGLLPNALETSQDDCIVYQASMQGSVPDRLFILTGHSESLDEIRKHHEQWQVFKNREKGLREMLDREKTHDCRRDARC